MNIGEKIKERRAVLNITQQELSEISGIGLRTIISIERGNGNQIDTLYFPMLLPALFPYPRQEKQEYGSLAHYIGNRMNGIF
ncbi:helix-turn-helix transcriptional regulator [Bacteroides sp.]|uniref:helix-turn-helix transcriptional regulator n=1 Tax=Bacteroides sp. TaxID=29523 RepID=UPI003AB3C18A